MKINLKTVLMAVAIALSFAVSCKPDNLDPIPDNDDTEQKDSTDIPPKDSTEIEAISNIVNPYADKQVSYRGETISIKFDAAKDWAAEIKLLTTPEGEWAKLNKYSVSGSAKKETSVRIVFSENTTAEERELELWLTAKDEEPLMAAKLSQAPSGTSDETKMNIALNTYMHDILKEDYLFEEAYNDQDIDLTVSYTEFLPKHLMSLGEINIEDGGYYRASLSSAGERYIYSNIQEVQLIGKSSTKAVQTAGLGFGPFLSTALSNNSQEMGIAPSYVRNGSPAESAGLRRGDIIYAVNGVTLTKSNYMNYMNSLYANPSGEYRFSFLRFEKDGEGGYKLNSYSSGSALAQVHIYNPILHASIINYPSVENPEIKIGYFVYEAFDITSQDFLEETIDQFIEAGIDELILDLRFNVGGAVPQSRWLSGCIVGAANESKVFTNVIYNDGERDVWKFDYGHSNDDDNLGKPKDLGLDRLFVICSYNTASASELLINSLKGIDFPVKLIGCRTEGKNVGMEVTQTTYGSRSFQFSPVTFRTVNAKGEGDYADGMEPDEYVNNDNTILTDDADNVFPYSFSDWGNMDYNIALQWAYCDITGEARWDEWTKQQQTKSSVDYVLAPFDAQPLRMQSGRYGSLIYEN